MHVRGAVSGGLEGKIFSGETVSCARSRSAWSEMEWRREHGDEPDSRVVCDGGGSAVVGQQINMFP